MRWQQLMTSARLGLENPEAGASRRTDFQRDFDRLVFSAAFRRLQDKTQVFPLAESDYVRTRLTHSLEVSCVGRSLGTRVGEQLCANRELSGAGLAPADVGAVVSAACLAHDIGNPPFGHSGEDAIRQWFAESQLGGSLLQHLSPAQRLDFQRFEGNAQGFRTLARLQSAANHGGMQLTCATLATFSKYPRAAWVPVPGPVGPGMRKHGFMLADLELFRIVAEATGLLPMDEDGLVWARHPLAYLVEAADDICYRIIDIEDGFREGLLSYGEVRDLFAPLLPDASLNRRLAGMHDDKERVEYLRARTINDLVQQVSGVFMDHESTLLAGRMEAPLLDLLPAARHLRAFLELATRRLYFSSGVVDVATAGFEVLGGLLEAFVAAVEDVAEAGTRASPRNRMLLHLMPEQFLGAQANPGPDLYGRLLGVTDFVSGMTDSYAVSLYKKLTGISLPGR